MKIHILIFCLVQSCLSLAQNELGATFNSCHSGRSVDLLYGKQLTEKSKIAVGILVNINQITHPDDLELYHKKRLCATSFTEGFGIHANYNRYLNLSVFKQSVFLFSDLQLKYSGTRNVEYKKVYYDSINELQFYDGVVNYYGPFLWMQNTYGVGMDVRIIDRLMLRQKIGFGVEYIYGPDQKYSNGKKKSWLEPAFIFNIGLVYQFRNR